jgi:hypothetical protein
MKNLKTYQTPELLVFPIDCVDLLTESDNDAEWDPNWNGIIS